MVYEYSQKWYFWVYGFQKEQKHFSTTPHFESRNDHVAPALYNDVFSMETLLISLPLPQRDWIKGKHLFFHSEMKMFILTKHT